MCDPEKDRRERVKEVIKEVCEHFGIKKKDVDDESFEAKNYDTLETSVYQIIYPSKKSIYAKG